MREEYDVFDMLCPNCGQTRFSVLLKPDTLTRIICPKCKIPTYIYVSSNLDILTFGEDEICPECGGTGKCPNCNGTGGITCPDCKGRGGWEQWFGEWKRCEKCGGTGKVECLHCKGTGVCPTCKGMRFVPKKKRK